MKHIYFAILAFPFFFNTLIFAQNEEWFVYDTTNSGLRGYYVNCLAIEENGNVWIGNYSKIGHGGFTGGKGLILYDGLNWTVYDTLNSGLPTEDISCITIDNSDTKWIGTYGGGLVKYDDENWIIYDITNSGIPSNNVSSICIDDSGNKWIGTGTGGLYDMGGLYDNGNGLAKFNDTDWIVYNSSNSELPSNNITCIEIDDSGTKYIGTIEGLVEITDGYWEVYTSTSGTSSLPTDVISCMAIDIDRNIWVGTRYWFYENGDEYGKGIVQLIRDTFGWGFVYDEGNSELPNNDIYCIEIDKHGNIWIGTREGLAKFNGDGVSSVEDDLTSTEIIPHSFKLNNNYPNPFNPTTTIGYQLPAVSDVELSIYNLTGQKVATLVSERQNAGYHKVEWDASGFASGLYYYRLEAGEFLDVKKMILLR